MVRTVHEMVTEEKETKKQMDKGCGGKSVQIGTGPHGEMVGKGKKVEVSVLERGVAGCWQLTP